MTACGTTVPFTEINTATTPPALLHRNRTARWKPCGFQNRMTRPHFTQGVTPARTWRCGTGVCRRQFGQETARTSVVVCRIRRPLSNLKAFNSRDQIAQTRPVVVFMAAFPLQLKWPVTPRTGGALRNRPIGRRSPRPSGTFRNALRRSLPRVAVSFGYPSSHESQRKGFIGLVGLLHVVSI
jgi:hypothetical protein